MNVRSIGALTLRCTPVALFLAGLLVAAPTAAADVAVVGVSPTVGRPGDRIVVRVGCGFCSRDATFPISLVPVKKAPRPDRRCGENALCPRVAAAPPRRPPYLFLGRTRGGKVLLPTAQPPGSESHLRFSIPNIEPGRYAFVIFSAESERGPRGSLIAYTGDSRDLLRVESRDPPDGPAGKSGGASPLVAVAAGVATLAIAAVLLLRRRRAA